MATSTGQTARGTNGSATKTVAAPVALGRNVTAQMDGTTLVLRVDTAQELGLSATGKTITVGTVGRPTEFHGVVIGLNVFKYPARS